MPRPDADVPDRWQAADGTPFALRSDPADPGVTRREIHLSLRQADAPPALREHVDGWSLRSRYAPR